MVRRCQPFVFVKLLPVYLLLLASCGQQVVGPGADPSLEPSILRLSGTIDGYVEGAILTPDQARVLTGSLQDARAGLNRGDVDLAQQYLDLFKRDAQALIEKGMLPDPQGQALVTQATGIQANLASMLSSKRVAQSLPPQITGCRQPAACEYSTFYVDVRSKLLSAEDRAQLDGSPEQPFPSILAALQQADQLDLCGLEVRVAPGSYEGDLNLSRDTRLLGDGRDEVIIRGSILNYGGFDLEVHDLTIQESGRHGGVFVDMPCADVQLAGVRIDRAERYGFYQRGGALTVRDSEILATRSSDASLYAGSGVFLEGGVQAAFSSTRIHENGSAGLVLQGGDTRVYGIQLAVYDNSINREYLDRLLAEEYPGFAAVEVREGALLLLEFSLIHDNEWAGLGVHDGGAAHFRYGAVSSTRSPEGADHSGGNNVLILEATAQFTNFTIDHADLAGLILRNAYLTLHEGEVSSNTVGVAIHPYDDPAYDPLRCIQSGVDWKENGINLDAALMPPPGDDADAQGAACPEVPFDCDWCGGQE